MARALYSRPQLREDTVVLTSDLDIIQAAHAPKLEDAGQRQQEVSDVPAIKTPLSMKNQGHPNAALCIGLPLCNNDVQLTRQPSPV